MEIINLAEDEGLPPVEWGPFVEKLADGTPPDPEAHKARTTWLTTVNEDGSPHRARGADPLPVLTRGGDVSGG